jgi:hypothetical protein
MAVMCVFAGPRSWVGCCFSIEGVVSRVGSSDGGAAARSCMQQSAVGRERAIGVQVEVSDRAVARRLSVKPGLSSMPWGGPVVNDPSSAG